MLQHLRHHFERLPCMASCLDCFFLRVHVWGRERLTQTPSMSLLLNYESAVINTTENKKASLPLTARGGMDYGLPHCFEQQQHRPQKSIWPQAAARATDIHMSSGGTTDREHQHLSGRSMGHRHQHGLQWQHRWWATRPNPHLHPHPVAAQTGWCLWSVLLVEAMLFSMVGQCGCACPLRSCWRF